MEKVFPERFSIPQTSPRFLELPSSCFPFNFHVSVLPLPLPPPPLANPFPFLPALQYRAVCRVTRSFYDAIYSRKWSSGGVLQRRTRETEAIRFESARFLVNRR